MAIDLYQFMEEASRIPGVPGYEAEIGRYYAEAARPYADEITTDALGSVTVRVGNAGPKVMIAAHHDEIGLMITDIEDDGCLRFTRNGGVGSPDSAGHGGVRHHPGGRALRRGGGKAAPSAYARGAEQGPEDGAALYRPGLRRGNRAQKGSSGGYGRDAGQAREADGHEAGLQNHGRPGQRGLHAGGHGNDPAIEQPRPAYYVATSQEEIGSKGAKTAAYSIAPDFAVAVDVTHGEGPGTGKWEAFPLEKMTIVSGPHLHPELTKICQETADKWRIPYTREIASGHTGTDASAIFNAHGGVPTILLSVPLRYMHTTVEVGDVDVIRDVGRLMALFIDEVARRWEEIKWY